MLKIRYAKNTYGPKCQNTHGPKLWLLDTWAWAHGPGRMGRRRPAVVRSQSAVRMRMALGAWAAAARSLDCEVRSQSAVRMRRFPYQQFSHARQGQ